MPSWKLSTGSYDPDKFYTEASDKSGRGDPLNARVPPQIAGTIAALVQSAKIPEYRTASDFVRDAIVHRLHTIGEKVDSGEITRTVNMVALLNDEIHTSRAKDDFHALVALIKTRHFDYGARSMEKANQYVKGRLAEIDSIPEDFQEDYEKELTQLLYRL